ncbi:uncharacterized protein N7482_001464 [Penicillium canariense]|uniref:FAD-binding domain-containing protein n=1 Tax=Penicillium canariense TaxID=189055 RepID=A0A9W9IFT9_9EURO|nr:uncharacterized protein N7482_001464 [Penicillium canariense]KAJ5175587.1 hypothetical protein N7482_001464 [Penicillium canariense]
MDTIQEENLRVIIIGGGIAGLTLANCLDRTSIDYVVLEKHREITANIGAAIALQPNGARILDQLGIYNRLRKDLYDINSYHTGFPNGSSFNSFTWAWFKASLGYPISTISRKKLLEHLYQSLKDTSNVHTGAKAVNIRASSVPGQNVIVKTADGREFTGDLIIGADGVHSMVRSEMWKVAESREPGSTAEEQERMKIDYICLVGSSKPKKTILGPHEIVNRVYTGVTFLIVPDVDGTIYWFVNVKLDRTIIPPSTPPGHSSSEIQAQVEALLDYHIWGDARFRDLWSTATNIASVPLAEGLLRAWSNGRIACIGDCAFKLTPNLGQGANISMECAADIANACVTLLRLPSGKGKPTSKDIEDTLGQCTGLLAKRLQAVDRMSQFTTRLQSFDSFKHWIICRYVLKYLVLPAYYSNKREMAAAVTLNYIPLPERARVALERDGRFGAKSMGALIFLFGLLASLIGALHVFR